MKDEMMAKIMDEVMKKMGGSEASTDNAAAECPTGLGINEDLCGLTEYVGTSLGHTIGLVIANLDYSVHELLKIDPKYRSIGIISDRTGDIVKNLQIAHLPLFSVFILHFLMSHYQDYQAEFQEHPQTYSSVSDKFDQ